MTNNNLEDVKHDLEKAGLLEFANPRQFDPPIIKALNAIVTQDKPTIDAKDKAYKLANLKNSHINVLILGETGSGKELFARLIHGDRHGKFIAVNCGGIPETLIESEFFGTCKGAATGAVDRAGYFEQAHNGTLFLDEIAELDRALQSKLLRVIQEKIVRRLGGVNDIPINCRIVSATNFNVDELCTNNKVFRQDLFYRLAGSIIKLNPLRERGSDVQLIANYISNNNTVNFPLPIAHDWPGNIRELINYVIEQKALNNK